MKTTRVFLIMLGMVQLGMVSLMAQSVKFGAGPDSTDCKNNLSFYKTYVTNQDFASAVSPWRKVLAVCPRTASIWPYVDGEAILESLMKEPGITNERKAQLVDTLLLMYDIRVEYYPRYANTTLLKKIMDLQRFRPEQEELRYSVIEEYLNLLGGNADPLALGMYMDLSGKLYADNKRTADEVMDAFTRTVEILDRQEALLIKKEPIDYEAKESITNTRLFAENILMVSGVASCENLIALFTPRFEANPEDLGLVSKIVSMLSRSDCGSSDLYVKSVTALNRLDPSYKTAYYLYVLHVSRGELDLALKYLLENVESADIPTDEKGVHMVDLAKLYFLSNNTTRAINTAKTAIEVNPAVKGKAYMLIGTIWAAQRCGENDIEKRAPFWVAVDYFERARAADSSLAEDANKQIAQYRQHFPLQEEAFMYDIMDGSSYTVTCGGLRETTTVRTRK